jgi:hypothetical protein
VTVDLVFAGVVPLENMGIILFSLGRQLVFGKDAASSKYVSSDSENINEACRKSQQ